MDDRHARRKLQNRLNQRASRRRRALLSRNTGHAAQKWTFYVPPETAESSASNNDLSNDTILARLWDRVNEGFNAHILSSELLFPVTQWNLISALYTNAATMGLTKALLAQDIISSFNTHGPRRNLPPSLQPTELQKSIIHHPWLDVLAVPSVRDAMLRNLERYDEEELCHDLVSGSGQSTGLVIWGDGLDPEVYELSEGTVRKWGWLWVECPDILVSTNRWRLRRGEEAIFF